MRPSQRSSFLLALSFFLASDVVAAERFYISIPGPTLSYTHLYYGQEKGFFWQEGLDLQVLVVRGIIGVSSLMSNEIDVTCHAGSGFAAALRGLPVKVVSVSHDRPVHELIVAPSTATPADLKGKPVAVGSLEGTAAVMTGASFSEGFGSSARCDAAQHGYRSAAASPDYRQGGRRHDHAAIQLSGPRPRLQGFWPGQGLRCAICRRGS